MDFIQITGPDRFGHKNLFQHLCGRSYRAVIQKRINMQLTFSPRAADEMMAMMFGQRLDFVSGKVAHRHTYKNQIDPLKTPSCPCCAAFGRAGPRFSSHLLSKPQKSLSFHFLVGRSSPGGE